MLRLWTLAATFSGLLSAAAFACPDLDATGASYVPVTGPYTVFEVEGVGGLPLDGCVTDDGPFASLETGLTGRLPANPTVVFDVQRAQGADLVFTTAMRDPAAEPGEGTLARCDTVMLVQAPDGTLQFSDDGGSANLSLITLPRIAGAYKVWAGSYSSGVTCEGQVRVADADIPCPDSDATASFRADMANQTWAVTAGGPQDSRACSAIVQANQNGLEGVGFITAAATLHIPSDLDVGAAGLEISVDSLCDTVLLGLDGAGNWLFSDDVGDSLNPSLIFAADGFSGVKIWVGSYDIATCEVDLTMGQQADAPCPTPGLPAGATATVGGSVIVQNDGSVDLATCAESLNGFSFNGFTGAAPDAQITIDSVEATSSLSVSLTSTCAATGLGHFFDENGADVWQVYDNLPFGADIVTLPQAGTYSFWILDDVTGGCSGTMTFAQSTLSCPDPTLTGKETQSYGVSDLSAGQRLPLVAGGESDVNTCAVAGLSASGWYIDRPDFVIELNEASSILFEGEGQCDTTLLVNDGNGDWHYDDDSAPDSNGGYLAFTASTPGPFQVWVGTYNEDLCEGALLVKRGLFKE